MLAEKEEEENVWRAVGLGPDLYLCVCVARHKNHLFHRSQKFLIPKSQKGVEKGDTGVVRCVCVGGGG